MAPKMYTEINGRLVPHPPDQDLPRATYPSQTPQKVVYRRASPLGSISGRPGHMILKTNLPKSKPNINAVVAGPSPASPIIDSDSDSDTAVSENEQPASAYITDSVRKLGNMSVSGKARTMERLSPDVQALRDIMQHRESVVVSEYNDDESTMFVEPEDEALAMELSSYARYDTDGTDVSMNDIGVVEPSQPAHTNQQSIQGSGTPTSTPSRHKRIRNMPYRRCGSKERAKRDEVIMAIRANWPRTQEFFPTRLAPRSSDPTTTYPLEPRDVSRPLLTAVQGLSSVTRDNHEKAFAAMIKAVKKRAKKEKTEEKLLLVDVEKALKACRAAEVYRLTTAQMQSSIGAPAPESLQAGTPRGTVMERGHSAEASSPMATGASSEHGAGETTGDATACGNESIVRMARLLADARALAGERVIVTITVELK